MILRDPVHGLIAFESDDESIIERLLATREVQRLRRIRQLGFTSLAYPGAEHTRFAHAVGTAHVMKRLAYRLRDIHEALPFWHRLSSQQTRDALAAALLHDIGHGPASHMFESALPLSVPHEVWTDRIVLDSSSDVHRVLASEDPDMPARVARLIAGQHELPYLARAVAGTFDVDRCDYLLRDAHATGVRYGNFDLEWFHRSLRFAPLAADGSPPPLAIDGAKGLAAIESFVLARLFMFQQVYFHKATRSAEWMARMALSRALHCMRDSVRLPNTPAAFVAAAEGREPTLGEYLELDDGVLMGTLHAWESSRDDVLASICKRLRARELFKSIELVGEAQCEPKARARAWEIARDISREAGLDPDTHVGLDIATDTPFDDSKDTLVVVYSQGAARKPGDVSFLLGRLNGESLTRVRLIVPGEIRDRIQQAIGA
ncbi:MAG: HD domain-containing protein [Deltaproteobacteria bacterium]|nr:HD domain-containing protein [Deltaproteobacteria bacterium]